MFKRKFYEQAVFCFNKAHEIELMKKAEAYFTADKAAEIQVEIDELVQEKKSNFNQ